MIDYSLEASLIDYNKSRYNAFKNGFSFEEYKPFQKIINARYCKSSRIKKRLVYLITHFDYLFFCTFTFDDLLLSKCDRTKRDYIKCTLNNFTPDIHYILNVDYGKKNEREHYHCIVATNFNLDLRKYLKENYRCFTSCDRIGTSSNDIKRLSKYINKLTNHCIKDTTKNKRIVYNFVGYDKYKELGRIMFIKDSYNLGLQLLDTRS